MSQVGNPWGHGMTLVIIMTGVDAQRAAMRRNFIDIEERQTMGCEDLFSCRERKIGEVLVINGVELVLLYQAQEVGEFHGDKAVGLKQEFHAGNEVVDIRNLREHVIAEE